MGVLDTVTSRYRAAVEKLAGKTFDLSDNTLTGTAAQFNAALSDNDFAMVSDLTSIAAATHAATSKTTPVDADEIPLADSAATFGLKKLTWANLKAALDSRYQRPTKYLSSFGSSPAWAGVALSSIGGTNVGAPSVNGGLFARILPEANLTLTSLIWVVNTQSGNYDISVHDSTGARLWSKGSTAVPAGGTVVTETVTGVTLTGGGTYYVGWAADNTTAGVRGLAIANQGTLQALTDGTPPVLSVATVFPIPSTVTLGSTAPNRLPFFAVRGT